MQPHRGGKAWAAETGDKLRTTSQSSGSLYQRRLPVVLVSIVLLSLGCSLGVVLVRSW